MRIQYIQSDNFKRLKTWRVEPNGKHVVVGGKNDQGKTSALDSFMALVGGKRKIPKESVRHGAGKATIEAGLYDETETYVATREIDEATGATRLKIKSKDGVPVQSAQTFFDALVSPMAFDPTEFQRMDGKKQTETLRKLAGLDFDAIDGERDEAYQRRTFANQEVKRLQGALNSLEPQKNNTPKTEISVVGLANELERRRSVNADNKQERGVLQRMHETLATIDRELAELAEKMKALEERKAKGRAAIENKAAEIEARKDEPTEDIENQIKNAEEINRNVRSNITRDHVKAELLEAEKKAKAMDDLVKSLDEKKAEMIRTAEYPIKGLEVTDDGVRFDGVPFENISRSAQLRCSVAIGAAISGGLKVMLVNGDALDDDNLKNLLALADEYGMQLFVEVVGDREGVTVLIEDGEVKEDRTNA